MYQKINPDKVIVSSVKIENGNYIKENIALKKYCENIKSSCFSVLFKVEEMLKNDFNIDKNSLSGSAKNNFSKIRNTILNCSNSIGRLPSEIMCDDDYLKKENMSILIANQIDKNL